MEEPTNLTDAFIKIVMNSPYAQFAVGAFMFAWALDKIAMLTGNTNKAQNQHDLHELRKELEKIKQELEERGKSD